MRFKHFFSLIILTLVLGASLTASAQSAPLRGNVKLVGKDGQPAAVAGAVVDVYRTDIKGDWHTKTEKNGDFVFAGLPLQGTYLVAVSAPGAQPNAKSGVRVINLEKPIDIVLMPGDGKHLTLEEAKIATSGGVSAETGTGTAEKAKREELIAKNKELEAKDQKILASNEVVAASFKAGAEALVAKNYDEALKQADAGIVADPEQAALWTLKANALKARGVDHYNAAVTGKDEAAKTAGIESAKSDFKEAAEAATKAVTIAKAEQPVTDPAEQARQNSRKYVAMSVRAEAMRLFVTKGDPSQVDAGIAAYQDYMTAETDPVKKSRAQLDLAQMLLDAGAGDKAYAEFQKVLAEKPDDPDANLGAGLSLFSTGDKAKYQEAANYLQRFVDKAPDTHKFKNDAKAILTELKNTENVVPEKTTTPARRKRP